jgi:hypothetical protein
MGQSNDPLEHTKDPQKKPNKWLKTCWEKQLAEREVLCILVTSGQQVGCDLVKLRF